MSANGAGYAIDQQARELATEAIAEIRQHAAVCVQAERDRDRRFADMAASMTDLKESMKDTLRAIQKAYETGQEDMHAMHALSISDINAAQDKHVEEDKEKFKDLYSRFWACAVALISLLLGIVGALIGGVFYLLSHPIHFVH
jgi:hypothetical protein